MGFTRILRQCSVLANRRAASSSAGPIKPTCLTDLHTRMGAKFAPFAGFKMPTVYEDMSIGESTLHVRKHCGIFDVSHMLQTMVTGRDCIPFIESLTCVNLKVKDGRSSLTVFLNEQGGIKDDLIVSRLAPDALYVVTNAGCIEKDIAHIQTHLADWQSKGKDVQVHHMHGHGLLAVQGPEAISVVQAGAPDLDLSQLYFMHTTTATVYGVQNCRVTRCGYTGEDGCEISVPPDRAIELCEKLLNARESKVKLIGLGARDALRLEAGLCLYGNDMDENTTIVQADLTWLLGKRRREAADFPGAQLTLQQLADRSKWLEEKVRVGFLSETGRPPRAGSTLITKSGGHTAGTVTSGCPAPSLAAGTNIGMAYVKAKHAKSGTQLEAVVGRSQTTVEVVPMPFVPTKYYVQLKKKKAK